MPSSHSWMVTLLLLWRPASRGHLTQTSFNHTTADQFLIFTVLLKQFTTIYSPQTLTAPWSWAPPCFRHCACAAASCSRATGRWWPCWYSAGSWRLGSAGCCSDRPPPAGGPPPAPHPSHSTGAIRLDTDQGVSTISGAVAELQQKHINDKQVNETNTRLRSE